MKLLQNPLIKMIGIIVVIYFALFANKNNPQSLGNRLSSERLKQNFREMEEKGKFIASNVVAARSYAKLQEEETSSNLSGQNQEIAVIPQIKDINLGIGKDAVLCGAEIVAFVSLNSEQTNAATIKTIEMNPEKKIIIGSKQDWFLEKNILGMKKGGIREIKIPQGFKGDEALAKLLQENKGALVYQIILQDILQYSSSHYKLNCND